ncbi:hypothetical protein D3C71_1430560 [compost metagenome]
METVIPSTSQPTAASFSRRSRDGPEIGRALSSTVGTMHLRFPLSKPHANGAFVNVNSFFTAILTAMPVSSWDVGR